MKINNKDINSKFKKSKTNFYKKSIAPVVATALLIVIVVIAVVGFQSWFQTSSSQIYTKSEITTNQISEKEVEILDIVGNQIFLKNYQEDNLENFTLKINNLNCDISNINKGINGYDITHCLNKTNTSNINIVLITDKTISEKKKFVPQKNQNGGSTSTTPSSNPTFSSFISNITNNIPYDSSINISWNTQNTNNCTASGDWTGIKSPSGYEIINNLNSNKTFNLICYGPQGNISSTFNVTVQMPSYYISCLDILNKGQSTGDGVYEIDPDGTGANSAFNVYCDMTNGGWVLSLVSLSGAHPYVLMNSATSTFPTNRSVSAAHRSDMTDLCPSGPCINQYKVYDTQNIRTKIALIVNDNNLAGTTNLNSTTKNWASYMSDAESGNWGRVVIYNTIDGPSGWLFWGQTRTGAGSGPVYSWGTGSSGPYFTMEIWLMTTA